MPASAAPPPRRRRRRALRREPELGRPGRFGPAAFAFPTGPNRVYTRTAVDGVWMIFFPSVVPVAVLLYLAWSVLRHTRAEEEAPPGAEGGPRRWRRQPRPPRGPRRGPHAPAAERVPG